MTTTPTAASATDATTARTTTGWRVIDIVVTAVLGVAVGLIFWAWNTVGGLWFGAMDGMTPGLGGLAVGIWLLGGVLGGLIIRKPGAALLVELIAAVVSAVIGNQWGITTIYSGLAQGIGAELIFLLFRYRRFTISVAALAGAASAMGAWILEFIMGNRAKSLAFNSIYLGSLIVSGIVLAGVIGWVLTRMLIASGALSRFAAGREATRRV